MEYIFCHFAVFHLHGVSLSFKRGIQPNSAKLVPQPKPSYVAYDVNPLFFRCSTITTSQLFFSRDDRSQIIQ